MEQLVSVVGSYRERDKLIRLVQYVSRFLAGNADTTMGRRFSVLATQIGSTRTVLRLFDDIPMLAHTLQYGTGAKEKTTSLRVLELISNVVNQLYYPLEHIAWCATNKIIDRPPGRWSTACVMAWAVALLLEILKALIRINLIRRAQKKMMKETELVASNERESAEMSQTIRGQIRVLKQQELDCYLAILENLSDFMNAVNWLPAGILWSGKFSSRTCGFFGTISSAIKLIRLHKPKKRSS